jgi:hypothetical protein
MATTPMTYASMLLRIRPRNGLRDNVSGDPMTAKIIYIERKRCCDCGKAIPKKSDQFLVNDKQVACSNCWTIRARRN